MKIVYIAHPVSGNVQGNIKKIIEIVREINLTEPNIVPFVPYLADIMALDDSIPEQRERGIKNDQQFFKRKSFDELWLYGNTISKGMLAECRLAFQNNILIFPKTQETKNCCKHLLIETF